MYLLKVYLFLYMINIPQQHSKSYQENWYYISRWHNFWDNPRRYVEKYATLIWSLICQESGNILSKDIRPKSNEYSESPSTGNQLLWLHTDAFFKEAIYKPEAIILLCVNPWDWLDWRTTISDINQTLNEYRDLYWEEEYSKLLQTRLKFDENKKVFMFGSIDTNIFQEFEWGYMNWTLFNDWFFSIMDFMDRDESLKKFQTLLNKNMKTLSRLNMWDIICVNNVTYAHWRTWPIWTDRHFIRTQVR